MGSLPHRPGLGRAQPSCTVSLSKGPPPQGPTDNKTELTGSPTWRRQGPGRGPESPVVIDSSLLSLRTVRGTQQSAYPRRPPRILGCGLQGPSIRIPLLLGTW